MSKKLFSKKGSALISSLIAASLLSMSGIGLLTYMANFRKTTSQTINQQDFADPMLKFYVTNKVKSLLMDTHVNEQGKTKDSNNDLNSNEYGLCSLVQKPSGTKVVEQIKMSFSNINSNKSFSQKRWQVFFNQPDWLYASMSKCKTVFPSNNNDNTNFSVSFEETGFNKCFQYIGKQKQSSQEIYAIASIKPFLISSDGSNPSSFSSISLKNNNTLYDPSNIFIKIEVAIASKDLATTVDNDPDDDTDDSLVAGYVSFQSDIMWASDVSECHINAKDNKLSVVYLGASGMLSPSDRFVLNALPPNDETCNEVSLGDINKDLVQAGTINDLSLRSVSAYNVRLACTKNKFTCREEALKKMGKNVFQRYLRRNIRNRMYKNDYDNMKFSISYLNSSVDPVPVTSMNFTLKNANGEEIDDINNDVLDGSGSVKFSWNRAGNQYSVNGNRDISDTLPRSSNTLQVSASGMDLFCDRICGQYKPGDSSTYVYPEVSIKKNKTCTFSKDYSKSESNRVHCTVCHTKACHSFGLGTFGPLRNEKISTQSQQANTQNTEDNVVFGLADEALDSIMPECRAKHAYGKNKTYVNSYQVDDGQGSKKAFKYYLREPLAVGYSPNNTGDCVYMKISSGGDREEYLNNFKNFSQNQYRFGNCNDKLPVLCFVNGHYLPAMERSMDNPNAPLKIVKSTFQDAQKTCYKMGKETGYYYNLYIALTSSYGVSPNMFNQLNSIPGFTNFTPTTPITPSPGLNIDITTIDIDENSTAKYTFINNASRGMFLSPPYVAKKLSDLAINRLKEIKTQLGSKIWVAMEKDSDGMVLSSVPWAPVATEGVSLFYNKKSKKLQFVVARNKDIGNSRYFALTHNIHWKGVIPKHEQSKLHFICQKYKHKEGTFFISKGIGQLSEGHRICHREKGLFMPPHSSLDWVKLMLELSPNDPEYSFPNPITDDSENNQMIVTKEIPIPKMAWVAFQLKEGIQQKPIPRIKDLEFYTTGLANVIGTDNVFETGNLMDSNNMESTNINWRGGLSTNQSRSRTYKVCMQKKGVEYLPDTTGSWTTQCHELDKDNPEMWKPQNYKFISYWFTRIAPFNSSYNYCVDPGNCTN